MNLDLMDYFWAFTLSVVIFVAFDFLWLAWVAKDLYGKQLKHRFKSPINYKIIAVFYALYIVGLNYFAIIPALNEYSITVAAVSGLLFGFFTYATYDLTNYATLKSWPKKIVVVDILWGSLLTMTVAIISYNLFIGLNGYFA